LHQRSFEPVDLLLAAGDDLACIGVPLDLGVEVIDQISEGRLKEWSGCHDPFGVGVRPTHVSLELAITRVLPIGFHLFPLGLDCQKKTTHRRRTVAWAFRTLDGRPVISSPMSRLILDQAT
jgi:hypothetical protein